jgi:hypothetical protein
LAIPLSLAIGTAGNSIFRFLGSADIRGLVIHVFSSQQPNSRTLPTVTSNLRSNYTKKLVVLFKRVLLYDTLHAAHAKGQTAYIG